MKLELYNQTEAAAYIAEHGISMSGPKLSNLTTNGAGPKCSKKGNQKLFFQHDLDAWIERERLRSPSQ